MNRYFLIIIFLLASPLLRAEESDMAAQAMEYDQKGDYRKALCLYLKLHAAEPLDRTYMNEIGYLYYKLGNMAKAKEYFFLTLRWYGDDADAKIWLGYIYYEEKDYVKAREFIEPVAKSYPYDIKTQILLANIQTSMKDLDASRKTLEAALKKDPCNPKLHAMLARIEIKEAEYHAAYESYRRAWQVSGLQKEYLDEMIAVRDFSRLALKTYSSYTRENEIDLLTNVFTTKMNTWYNGVEFSMPFPDAFRFYVKGAYNTEQQYNEITESSNYNVNKYIGIAGMEYQYLDHVYLKLESGQKWATDRSSAIFAFDNRFVWQPKLELGLSLPSVTYGAKLYKESFIGRNFQNVTSYFVFKKGVMNGLTFHFFDGLTQFGAQGSMNLVSGSIINKLKNFQGFFIQKIDVCPIKAFLEYRYLWGSYQFLSEDYFSYRARYRNEGTLKLQKPWGNRHLISLRYTYKWQKLRDFINVAEEITSATNPQPPQQISSNIMHANEWELVLKTSIRDHFTLEGSCLYYHDTNQYQIFNGRFSLNFYF